MALTSSMLRLTWATIVEHTPHLELSALTDTALVKLIMQQVSNQLLLSGEEVCALYEYIGSRTVLIREIADASDSRRSSDSHRLGQRHREGASLSHLA